MNRLRRHRGDLFALLILVILPLLWFAPVLFPALSGRTLLPFDNLYGFEPWRNMQPGLIPHNDLLSDLVLENAVWKLHIRRTLAGGQLPLWNPQLFSGQPFFAAGQASVAYPLSILFYVLPLETAYGWFTAIQIALAGINMYILGRVLRLRVPAALFSGVVYMFSGFLIVSVVFTMFIAAAAWLPLLLAVIEIIIRKQEEKGVQSFRPIPYVVVGAFIIGLTILAGHPELIYYTLLVAGAYSAVRLFAAWRVLRKLKIEDLRLAGGEAGEIEEIGEMGTTDTRTSGHPVTLSPGHALLRILKLAAWLLAMVILGIGLGAVQLIPLVEFLPYNFREGSATLAQVRGWAWPIRHVLTFALPNIFGSPSHHQWFDIWDRTWVPATLNALGETNHTIFWGIKNYVEGGNYLGIATWLLAAIAVIWDLGFGIWDFRRRRKPDNTENPQLVLSRAEASATCAEPGRSILNPQSVSLWFFATLALVSLLFAFGTPLYAILYHGLPGWSQLHSPFRWVFPFTLSMALLGGMGLNVLMAAASPKIEDSRCFGPAQHKLKIGARRVSHQLVLSGVEASSILNLQFLTLLLAALTTLAGLGALALVVVSVVAPDSFIAFGQRIVDGSDLAQMAFADGRMFWSYQAANLMQFGLFALLSGLLTGWMAWRGWKINDSRCFGPTQHKLEIGDASTPLSTSWRLEMLRPRSAQVGDWRLKRLARPTPNQPINQWREAPTS